MFNKHLSLSQRVKLTFIVSFVVLSIISLALVFTAVKTIEDYIFETELERKVEQYQFSIEKGDVIPLPPEFSVYGHRNEIPRQFSQYMTETLAGIYELDHPNELDYHYAIVNGENGQQLFFIYDVNDIELSEELEHTAFQFIAFAFVLLLFVFFLIFQTVLKRALAPMHQLIQQVKNQAEQPDNIIDYDYPNDNEIGLLTKTLKSYSQRIESFIQREREFSGFASHELRTPVTIIKGATELLELQELTHKQIGKPLARILRATKKMEDTIEVLLNLSREQGRTESQCLSINSIFQQTLNDFQDKALQHHKVINVSGKFCNELRVEKIPTEIVFANIIKNAIQHATSPEVTITLDESSCLITNHIQTCSQKENSHTNHSIYDQGYGLGKLIIDRICQQQHWHYKEWIEGEKYFVQISYRQPPF